MSRYDDPLHDQRMEERDRNERDLARQYALETLALADPEPPRRREQRPRRPSGPQWGDDITDPINGPSPSPEERAAAWAEYMADVAAHSRRKTW